MPEALIILVVTLLIFGVIFSILWWAVNSMGLFAPFQQVARAILILIAVIILIYLLLGLLPEAGVKWIC